MFPSCVLIIKRINCFFCLLNGIVIHRKPFMRNTLLEKGRFCNENLWAVCQMNDADAVCFAEKNRLLLLKESLAL